MDRLCIDPMSNRFEEISIHSFNVFIIGFLNSVNLRNLAKG